MNTDTQNNRLVWIDLEMTGLNPQHDVILEIATIITDTNLAIIAEGPVYVIHQEQAVLDRMHDTVKRMHAASGLTDRVLSSSVSLADAYRQTFDFIKQHCVQGHALLAGNSIWQDRAFLQQYMPDMVAYMFYRMIDVSTIKQLVRAWYPDNEHVAYVDTVLKKETHRAHEDIKESIAELQHYRTYFFIPVK